MANKRLSDLSQLLLITVAKNNPEELSITCQSILAQSISPIRHVIVDGSDAWHRGEMKRLSTVTMAEYIWAEPEGIYRAMLKGLDVAEPNDWVWFLNATDWLSSSESVGNFLKYISLEDEAEANIWWVGKTFVGGELPHLIKFPSSGQDFVNQIRRGSIGLPHSSTIVRAAALRAVRAFEGPYRISLDYEMALRLVQVFGPPGLIPFALSVYDENGESARNAWRNVLHKSEARLKNQPWWHLPAEPFRILAAGKRELLRRQLIRNPANDRLWQALGWERIAPDLARPFWHQEIA